MCFSIGCSPENLFWLMVTMMVVGTSRASPRTGVSAAGVFRAANIRWHGVGGNAETIEDGSGGLQMSLKRDEVPELHEIRRR